MSANTISAEHFEKLNFSPQNTKNLEGLSKLDFNFFLKDFWRANFIECDRREAKMKQLCK